MQKVTIEIPFDRYDGFVNRCEPWSRQFSVLKNGIIVRRPKSDERIVEIQCSVDEAKGLLDKASRVYPTVMLDIKDALANPRDS